MKKSVKRICQPEGTKLKIDNQEFTSSNKKFEIVVCKNNGGAVHQCFKNNVRMKKDMLSLHVKKFLPVSAL